MVRYDIRFAALAADAERRVRLAVRALGMHDVETSVEPWQGSGCTAVVVDTHDGYGRQVMEVATRRRVAVLALGDEAGEGSSFASLPADASIAAIAQSLQRLLGISHAPDPRRANARAAERADGAAGEAPGLLQLASNAWRERDLEARFGPRTIWLQRGDGRALAHTLSDLIEARNQLCSTGWQFREVPAHAARNARAEVGTSLDTLLVQGALRGEAQLPRFPDVPCSLAHWPDLGAATDALEAMQVAAPLLRRACTPEQLRTLTQLDATRVDACLWAFDAAGLLQRTAPRELAHGPPPAPRGLWSRFAARFGLGPSSATPAGSRPA